MMTKIETWLNKLINVKTFVTLILTISYVIMIISGINVDDKFINIYQLIIVFYFTYKNNNTTTK